MLFMHIREVFRMGSMGSAEPVKFSDPMKGNPWIFEDLTQLLSQIWDLEPTKFWKELTWNP